MFLSRKNIMRGWVIIALGLGGWKGATCISLAGNYQEEASDDGGKSTGKEQPARQEEKLEGKMGSGRSCWLYQLTFPVKKPLTITKLQQPN